MYTLTRTLKILSLALTLSGLPTLSHAGFLRHIDPAYRVTDTLRLGFRAKAIALDGNSNLYTLGRAANRRGRINILKYNAASGYRTRQLFGRFHTPRTRFKLVTGLTFLDPDHLVVSERFRNKRSGQITTFDLANGARKTRLLRRFRPTDITHDDAGNILFSARHQSPTHWGKVFSMDSNRRISLKARGLILNGIALDGNGDYIVSTPSRNYRGLLGRSIYRINTGTLSATLIARFNRGIDALAVNEAGDIFALLHRGRFGKSQVVTLSAIPPVGQPPNPVPLPPAVLMFLPGLAGLWLAGKRKA